MLFVLARMFQTLRKRILSHSRSLMSSNTFLLPVALALGCLFGLSGCQTPPASTAPAELAAGSAPESQTLQEGDTIRISFPGTPNLDTEQQIRRDGRITLSILGELRVVGMTPTELEKELVQRYSSQRVLKEVLVSVVSSPFTIFVTGAVRSPGKIQPGRPLTALEAVMEAGGFDYSKADTKAVTVIRTEGGKTKNYVLNLQLTLDGKPSEPFYLKPSDIVYVKEKFVWF